LFKVIVVLMLALLCHKTFHTDDKETNSMMACVKRSARFKLVSSDVFKQHAIAKLAERWDLFSQILEERLQHHGP
jgi:hypothetical protein